MPTWDDFFIAEVGASAALTGLLFVGISFNMQKIVIFPALPNRAEKSLGLLMGILILSSLLLVPGPSIGPLLGLEVLGIALAASAIVVTLSVRVLRLSQPEYRTSARWELILTVAVSFLYVVAGVAIVLSNADAFDLFVPAMLLSFVIAIVDSWVLLVEINR